MMSSSTRSGGVLRGELAAPSRRSARGSACGRPSSLRPGCPGWPWRRPRAARGSRRAASAWCPCRLETARAERLFQRGLRVGEGVAVHQPLEFARTPERRRARRSTPRLASRQSATRHRTRRGAWSSARPPASAARDRRRWPAERRAAAGSSPSAAGGGDERGENGGELLAQHFQARGVGPFADGFLQRARRRLHRLRPEIGGDALDGVRGPFGRGRIAGLELLRDLRGRSACCATNWRSSFKYSFRLPATRRRPSAVSRPAIAGRSPSSAEAAPSGRGRRPSTALAARRSARRSRTGRRDRSAWRRGRSCPRRGSAASPRSWRARSWR